MEKDIIKEEEPDLNNIEYNSKKFKLNYYSDSEKIIIKLESIHELMKQK